MRSIFLMAVILVTTTLSANAADAARGATLYKTCVQCHGNAGEGKDSMKAPRIGGQFDWYIVSSLKQFKNKTRKNPTMFPFIAKLNDKDFEDLAAYVSTLK